VTVVRVKPEAAALAEMPALQAVQAALVALAARAEMYQLLLPPVVSR